MSWKCQQISMFGNFTEETGSRDIWLKYCWKRRSFIWKKVYLPRAGGSMLLTKWSSALNDFTRVGLVIKDLGYWRYWETLMRLDYTSVILHIDSPYCFITKFIWGSSCGLRLVVQWTLLAFYDRTISPWISCCIISWLFWGVATKKTNNKKNRNTTVWEQRTVEDRLPQKAEVIFNTFQAISLCWFSLHTP